MIPIDRNNCIELGTPHCDYPIKILHEHIKGWLGFVSESDPIRFIIFNEIMSGLEF